MWISSSNYLVNSHLLLAIAHLKAGKRKIPFNSEAGVSYSFREKGETAQRWRWTLFVAGKMRIAGGSVVGQAIGAVDILKYCGSDSTACYTLLFEK